MVFWNEEKEMALQKERTAARRGMLYFCMIILIILGSFVLGYLPAKEKDRVQTEINLIYKHYEQNGDIALNVKPHNDGKYLVELPQSFRIVKVVGSRVMEEKLEAKKEEHKKGDS